MRRTPSQTIGPFFAVGARTILWPDGPLAVPEGTPGAVWIRGRVLDGAGAPVPDAMVETWQVEPDAFGRCPTDGDGRYAILTVPSPRIAVVVFARGLLDRLVTCTAVPAAAGAEHRCDIHLQGARETAFFAV